MNEIKRRAWIKNQNESHEEIKQRERKQKRGIIIDEDNDLSRFFELATSDKNRSDWFKFTWN